MKIRDAEPADGAGIARVQVDTWRTAYRGIVPDAHLTNLSYERSRQRWEAATAEWDRRGKRIRRFVVEDEQGRVIGFAVGGPRRPIDDDAAAAERLDLSAYDGELFGIYVLQDYQGKGFGRLLVERVARHLAEIGLHSMAVWVLADNPAWRFYEILGGIYLGAKDIQVGGVTLKEVVYGWRDITILTG